MLVLSCPGYFSACIEKIDVIRFVNLQAWVVCSKLEGAPWLSSTQPVAAASWWGFWSPRGASGTLRGHRCSASWVFSWAVVVETSWVVCFMSSFWKWDGCVNSEGTSWFRNFLLWKQLRVHWGMTFPVVFRHGEDHGSLGEGKSISCYLSLNEFKTIFLCHLGLDNWVSL